MRAIKPVAFVVFLVVAAVSFVACAGIDGGPTSPGQVENPNSLPMGVRLPNQPYPANVDYPPLNLIETSDSFKPRSPTAITVKMGRLIRVSCGPTAPSDWFCVEVENTTARLDASNPHTPLGGAHVYMSASADCQPSSSTIIDIPNVPPGEERQFQMNLNGGTRGLSTNNPCGIYFSGDYEVRGDQPNPLLKRRVKAEGVVRLQKN